MRVKLTKAAWTGIVACLVAVAGCALWAKHLFGSQPASQAPDLPAPLPVVAGQVQRHDVPIYLRGIGTVIAFNNVIVRSQITGQIVKISFVEGQTVRKGDLLAEIDPRPYQAQLDQAIADRERDQAHLANAQIDLDRYTALAAEKSIAQQQADSQHAIVAQLIATIKSDDAIIESARVNLGYTNLTSPIDGVTGIRQIDIGNIINPADTGGLVDVTQIEPISVIFTLSEGDFVQIQEQMADNPLTILIDDKNGKTLDQGALDLIDNQINQTTGTIRLRGHSPNNKHLLWPGKLVNVRLLLETRHDALTIDSSAVQRGPSGSYVYLIGNDQTVQLQPVTVAPLDDGQALITSGLAPGQAVVVAGQNKLQPGARVTELHGKAAQQVKRSEVEQEVP